MPSSSSTWPRQHPTLFKGRMPGLHRQLFEKMLLLIMGVFLVAFPQNEAFLQALRQEDPGPFYANRGRRTYVIEPLYVEETEPLIITTPQDRGNQRLTFKDYIQLIEQEKMWAQSRDRREGIGGTDSPFLQFNAVRGKKGHPATQRK